MRRLKSIASGRSSVSDPVSVLSFFFFIIFYGLFGWCKEMKCLAFYRMLLMGIFLEMIMTSYRRSIQGFGIHFIFFRFLLSYQTKHFSSSTISSICFCLYSSLFGNGLSC